MKRFALLALTAPLALLAACGGTTQPAETPAAPAPSAIRWSKAQVSVMVGRATTAPSRTTARGLSVPIPRIAASG